MSTKHLDERITTRYGEPDRDIYQQVMDLVEKERIAKSRAQLLLVKRGLLHTQNPEPLIKEKVVYRDREVPVEKIVEKVVYKSPPKVDTSTPHTQEHVRGDDHITEQSASKGQAQNSGQGNPPSSPNNALGEKKSLKKENGVSGWSIAGGLGIVGLLIYILVR